MSEIEQRLQLLEDEQSILNLIVTTLTSEGYSLLRASSGDEALTIDAAAGRPPDLVVTDAKMPGISGIELARTLAGRHPGLPVIVMSSDTQLLKGSDLGSQAISLLQKPFTTKQLRGRVRAALNRRQP